MFNLLMFNIDWKPGRVSVPLDRVFEYTDRELAAQFKDGASPALNRLTTLPCLFCVEGTEDETAYVGWINRAQIVGSSISLEVSFDADIPQLQNRLLYAKRNELHMPEDFEFSRNHWAVKNVDLYRFLLGNVKPRRQRPSVFQIPEHENIEPTLVSVMMPFEHSLGAVYTAIGQAATNAGLRCRRADDIWENPAIIQDVVSLIDRSRIVICDCTNRNPNVFYEAGIAHTLGREVILIAQNDLDIPFDLRHLRYVRYLNNTEGRGALTLALQGRMQTILGH
ncbi:MAG: hypothetical protein JNL01_03205 [Bdellovibrionales bacterium]|nr:hypothetical protein [Bdellovibrionales bacterium]